MNERMKSQHGQSIVIVAMAMIVLLIFGSFAIDLSFAYYQRRAMQNAADAAALAGARSLGIYQSDPTAPTMTTDDLYLIIQEYAARNKAKYVETYYTGPGGVRLAPITPGSGAPVPKSGPTGVEVIASTDFSSFFSRVIGYELFQARADAAATYGAATAAKYVVPLAIEGGNITVGEEVTLYDKNQSTGEADTGWLALTCRYPSSGSYCYPENPELRDWMDAGYPGVTRVPGLISGTPSHDYWSNLSVLQPGDVIVLPVFNGVYHYTHYDKCKPSYIEEYGSYECYAEEEWGGVTPVYTENTAYEDFYFYNIVSFAALEVHHVSGDSVTGEFVPYTVEGDWVNPNSYGVFIVKLTDNKGRPTPSLPTPTVPPAQSCDASLSLVFTPQDATGCGPYVFTFTVENTGEQGSARDVIIQIYPTKGQEWIQSITPEVWNVGELAAGETKTVQVVVTMNEDWPYEPPRGAEVGAEIKLEASVIAESCRPDHNVGKRDTATGIKDANCVPNPPTATPEPLETLQPPPATSTPLPTATPSMAGDHIIEFITSTYDGENTTYTYRVTSGTSPSLSNWVLSLADCFGGGDVVSASEYVEFTQSDPHSHLRGVKFDTGYDDGETRIITITLRGHRGRELRQFSVKAGGDILFGTVTGPACEPDEEPTTPTPTEELTTPTPTPTPTSTEEPGSNWVTGWSGSFSGSGVQYHAYSLCQFETGWINVTGTVSIEPDGAAAYLQKTWRVINPPDASVCPPEVPNCLETQYETELIHGDTEFTLRAWWPGIRPTDEVVEIHYGANILDESHTPLQDGIGLDIYWYPWVCAAPTATPTPTHTLTPAPTATPDAGQHSITFLNRTFDGENTTFTYEVTSGTGPAISNWVLSLAECLEENNIVSASELTEFTQSDPNSGLRGVKFDTGYGDGETRIVSVTFQGELGEETRQFSIKAGQDVLYGTVTGPACTALPTSTPTSGTTPTPTNPPTATPTPTATPLTVRINAGGGTWYDDGGNEWVADQYFSDGTAYNPGTTDEISGTTMDYMLQRYRAGSQFYYLFTDIPNGDYVIKLWFIEPWWTQNGKRKFKVFINGTKVLNNFDIHAEVGHDYKLVKTFTTTVTNNQLKINFMVQKDEAIVSGLTILGP